MILGVAFYGFCEEKRLILNELLPETEPEAISADMVFYMACGAVSIGFVLLALACYAWNTTTESGIQKVVLFTLTVRFV